MVEHKVALFASIAILACWHSYGFVKRFSLKNVEEERVGFQRRILYTALANILHYNKEMNLYSLRVHQHT